MKQAVYRLWLRHPDNLSVLTEREARVAHGGGRISRCLEVLPGTWKSLRYCSPSNNIGVAPTDRPRAGRQCIPKALDHALNHRPYRAGSREERTPPLAPDS